MDTNDKKLKLTLFTAIGALAVGCGMLITSLIMPPPGEIDHSVLVAFGEILTFAGALFGVGFAKKNQK